MCIHRMYSGTIYVYVLTDHNIICITTTVNDRITLNEGAQLFLEPGPLLCEGVETHIRRTAHFRGLPAVGRQHQDRAGPVRDRYVCTYGFVYVCMYVCM